MPLFLISKFHQIPADGTSRVLGQVASPNPGDIEGVGCRGKQDALFHLQQLKLPQQLGAGNV